MRPNTLATAAALLVIVLFGAAAPASAQRLDLGAGVSDFYVGYGNGNFVGGGPLVTIHFSEKHALQVVTDLRYRHSMNSTGITGIYSVQYRRTFRKVSSPTAFFLTAGTVGGLNWTRVSGFSYIETGHYENFKWVATEPKGVDFETRTRFSVTPPWVPVIGGGIERDVTKRVALRAEAAGAFGPYGAVGVRIGAGAVVRLGNRYRE